MKEIFKTDNSISTNLQYDIVVRKVMASADSYNRGKRSGSELTLVIAIVKALLHVLMSLVLMVLAIFNLCVASLVKRK